MEISAITVNRTTEIAEEYENSFDSEFQIPDDTLYLGVPKFTLQPIIENALLHGLKENGLQGTITLTASVHQQTLTLQVADNGSGMDADTLSRLSSNNKLSEQLRRLKQEKARLLDTDSDDLADRTRDLMDVLEDGPDFLDSFDAELFDALVDKIIVDSNERLRFRLKNSLELAEQIERTKR